MAATLDQTADTSLRDLHRYSKLYSLPEYVKKASHSKICNTDGLASTVFADVRYRQFPCHTKAATWLSYLYFLEKRADMHEKIAGWIEQRLDQYTEYWGLRGDVDQLRTKHADLHAKDPLPDSSFMLVWASDNGQKQRQYPITGPASLKQAAEWFAEHRYHFPFEDRLTMANKLVEKAAEYGCGFQGDLDELIEKQAGRGCYRPSSAATHIRNRVKSAVKVPENIRERMLKLADAVENAPGLASDPTHCRMLARTIDDFDQVNHMMGKYSALMPSPEDVAFSALWKVARAFVDTGCALVTGSIYDRHDFSKLALGDVRDAFGDEIAQAVSDGIMIDCEKMAEIAATLPRADAQLFDRMLSDNGISPVVKQAAAFPRISHGQMQQLAEVNSFAQAAPRTY